MNRHREQPGSSHKRLVSLARQAFRRHDFATAVPLYRQALGIRPRDAQSICDVGICFIHLGRPSEALAHLMTALGFPGPPTEAASALSLLLSELRFDSASGIDLDSFRVALSFDGIDWQPITRAVVEIMKNQSSLGAAVQIGWRDGWHAAARWLMSGRADDVIGDRLMLECLAKGINVDVEWELLLTAARRHVLLDLSLHERQRPVVRAFQIALIRQCRANEYVFSLTDEERERVRQLVAAPGTGIDGLALAAMYRPLSGILGDDLLGQLRQLQDEHPFFELVAECHMDRQFQAIASEAIIPLGQTDDAVSGQVAIHYEENPYPRWLSVTMPRSGSRRDDYHQFFARPELAFFDRTFHVLVAGCGTGKQAVSHAVGYGQRATIHALDLSRASLSYAASMAKRYGLGNMRFIQGDILGLAALDRTFDVIHCEGVLHHMGQPLEGWRALMQRLRPGGIMSIALYSEAARQALPSFATDIAGLSSDERHSVMGHVRHRLMVESTPEQRRERSLFCADFFSTSSCRDLLFHSQEHRFTIPRIAECLRLLGLSFRGFVLPSFLMRQFRQEHPDPAAWLDLARWHAFEQAHPTTFSAMYQFWCSRAE